MMRCPKRSFSKQRGARPETACDAVQGRDLECLVRSKRGQEAWKSHRQHGLARAGLAREQQVVPPRSRDLEGPLRGYLASDFFQDRPFPILSPIRRTSGAGELASAAEEGQNGLEVGGSECGHVGYSGDFSYVIARHDQGVEIGLGTTTEGHRENAPYGTNRSVQPELADERRTLELPFRNRARPGEHPDQERKVERRAGLGNISGREVHGDPQARNPESEIRGRSSNALDGLAGGRRREPAGPDAGRAAPNRDLDADSDRFYTDERESMDDVKHTSSCTSGFNVTSNEDRSRPQGTGARSRSRCWS